MQTPEYSINTPYRPALQLDKGNIGEGRSTHSLMLIEDEYAYAGLLRSMH